MPVVNLLVALGLMLLRSGPSDPATPVGRRVPLGVEGAALFIPDGYRPAADGAVDVIMHLHGAASVVEPAIRKSGWPGVLVTFNRKGLSRVYTEPFSDPTLFPRLLEGVRVAMKEGAKGAVEPKIGRVVVSSFSAGFGGVRELLKTQRHFDRIDGLIMLDSIYCGYEGEPSQHRPDPKLMDGFRRFALEAAAGRKRFLISHSAQVPDGYASTTETANYLIEAVGGQSRPRAADWAPGWRQTREFSVKHFVVLGFAGIEGADHMNHLRHVDVLWKYYQRVEADS
jgi:hypothetical protein